MERSQSHYERVASAAPALTAEREQELARLWQRQGDERARNLLVQSQFGYVLAVARRNRRPNVAIDELLAEGSLGLLCAANKFDPERGYRFFTYAKHWVVAYVSHCVNHRSVVTVKDTRLLSKVKKERTRAHGLVGEGLQARRMIADRMKLSDDEVDALLCMLDQREVSFEALAPEQIASESQAHEENEADPEQCLIQRVDSVQREAMVRAAVGILNARELRIVTRRLMADSDSMLTLSQLGNELGVSRERVRQLEDRVKQKLATQLRALAAQNRGTDTLAA